MPAPPSAPAYAADGLAGEGGDEPPPEPFVCQFCGVYDESFTDDKLDLHYWKDCPMLTSCEQCGQVVEVASLNEHLVEECDRNQAFRYNPPLGEKGYRGCPLCGIDLPDDPEDARRHLVYECQGNPRGQAAPP